MDCFILLQLQVSLTYNSVLLQIIVHPSICQFGFTQYYFLFVHTVT